MQQISDEDAYDLLSRAGFTVLESYRLMQLRQEYQLGKIAEALLVPIYSATPYDQKRDEPSEHSSISNNRSPASISHLCLQIVQRLIRAFFNLFNRVEK